MPGIYIHIPFCKSRCRYCDFYSTTLLEKREEYVDALLQEIDLRHSYLPQKQIETIYLGGGTPSLLPIEAIQRILKQINTFYDVEDNAEITLEANPGDLTMQYLTDCRQTGINRLSIGIQSFNSRLLELMGRRHSTEEAINSVKQAQEQGFDNISIDLIYGLPTQTLTEWQNDLDNALKIGIQHISTYCLSYENGTPFTEMLHNGQLPPTDDETANQMYETVIDTLQRHHFMQYEVSNFSLPGFRSKHNSSYWNDIPYIGIGAAAHSYDGNSRQWNTANLQKYIEGIQAQNLYYEKEILTNTDKYNERVMLSLRTLEGLKLNQLSAQEANYCLKQAQPDIDRGLLLLRDGCLTTSLQGRELLNTIIEHLIIA